MADDNMYTQRLKNASLLEMPDSAGRMLTFLSIDMYKRRLQDGRRWAAECLMHQMGFSLSTENQ